MRFRPVYSFASAETHNFNHCKHWLNLGTPCVCYRISFCLTWCYELLQIEDITLINIYYFFTTQSKLIVSNLFCLLFGLL